MSYADPRIQECVSTEFLANRNIWNIKVPLELDILNKIDLRGRLEEDLPTFHKKYIEMWECRYEFLPTHEPFLTSKLAMSSSYMDWFKHNDKLYLLLDSERSSQCCCRRPR
ncbi:hypothetical protein Golax_017929 [Gossypium laxum]|uniref:Uncharacterized protein n=1 Tax=Gossypium laxum TaxID=34288 RepID=A0A7J8Z1T5_9ROSI|nr:hypothetical protein [Gossypium laxum]